MGESEKSQKSIKSMIMSPDSENKSNPKKENKKSVKIAEETVEEEYQPDEPFVEENLNELDEQTRLENLRKLSQRRKTLKSPKSPTIKSPTCKCIMWDKVRFGGKISKEEMASLDRTVGKPEDGGHLS